MLAQHAAQFLDLLRCHALGRQPAGHALERFAQSGQLAQFLPAQRHDAGARSRHAHQELLTLQPVQRLAQRSAADAVGAGQLRLGDLAARRDVAFDDGRLDLPQDVVRERPAGNRRLGRQLSNKCQQSGCCQAAACRLSVTKPLDCQQWSEIPVTGPEVTPRIACRRARLGLAEQRHLPRRRGGGFAGDREPPAVQLRPRLVEPEPPRCCFEPPRQHIGIGPVPGEAVVEPRIVQLPPRGSAGSG